jgi:hypothetical protein
VQLPEIRAAIELQRGQPAKAVELLASASPYERAYPEAVYLRGLAYRGPIPADTATRRWCDSPSVFQRPLLI